MSDGCVLVPQYLGGGGGGGAGVIGSTLLFSVTDDVNASETGTNVLFNGGPITGITEGDCLRVQAGLAFTSVAGQNYSIGFRIGASDLFSLSGRAVPLGTEEIVVMEALRSGVDEARWSGVDYAASGEDTIIYYNIGTTTGVDWTEDFTFLAILANGNDTVTLKTLTVELLIV